MTPVFHTAQLFVLAGVLFLALGSIATHVLVRAVGSRVAHWEPHTRHRALVVLAALPIILAATLLFAASLPALVTLVLPGFDHCAVHDDGHAHLCFVHLPRSGIHLGLVLAVAVLALVPLVRGAVKVWRVREAQRIVGLLVATSEQRIDLGITIVESLHPQCFTAGLLRPRVLLSRGLFDALTSEERSVVLAHELAHVRRRDALLVAVVDMLGVLHTGHVRRWLVRELSVAAEQACDEEAVMHVRDRMTVAATILSVERMTRNARPAVLDPITVACAATAVERRVEALLCDPLPPPCLRRTFVLVGAVVAAVLLLANEVHHVTESVLSVVAH